MTCTIWHNPRCSKSRQTLALLEERGVSPRVRQYLKDPPSEAELRDVAALLGGPVISMMRRSEAAFGEMGLSTNSDDAALFAAMVAHPILIERPIVLNGATAAIGRPPEAVLDIL